MAPPVTVWTKENIEKLRLEMVEYLHARNPDGTYVNVVPNISLFAFEHGLSRTKLYEFEELKEVIALFRTKKESDLEKGTLDGTLNAPMAIFSLKQIGWTDKQVVDLTQRRPITFDPAEDDDGQAIPKAD